jgi:serine/threonine-protein kinase HipA
MHLKNWSLLYLDGRMPTLAPGYDHVSRMRYMPERGFGLPLARTKDVSRLGDELQMEDPTTMVSRVFWARQT